MFLRLLTFLGFDASSKLAMRIWAIATITGLVAILWVTGQTCAQYVCGPTIQGISSSHPGFAVGLGLAFNPTTYALASCYMTVWSACQLYVYKKTILDKML